MIKKIKNFARNILRRFQLDSLLPAEGANQMFQRAPCVAFHKLVGQLLVLRSDGLQQRRHLRIHFRAEAIQAVEKVEEVEVGHRLREMKRKCLIIRHN